ncbi:hypothetical protein H0H92_016163, partial [Tricholoma furcatifolium]
MLPLALPVDIPVVRVPDTLYAPRAHPRPLNVPPAPVLRDRRRRNIEPPLPEIPQANVIPNLAAAIAHIDAEAERRQAAILEQLQHDVLLQNENLQAAAQAAALGELAQARERNIADMLEQQRLDNGINDENPDNVQLWEQERQAELEGLYNPEDINDEPEIPVQ